MSTVGASRVSRLLPLLIGKQQIKPKPAPVHVHPAFVVPSRQQSQCKKLLVTQAC